MIDSHSHINHEDFIVNPKKYIEDAMNSKVTHFLCVGWDLKSSIDAIEIANQFDNVYASIGIHPSDVLKMKESDFSTLESLLDNKKIIAIGEVGLDFHYEMNDIDKKTQIKYFHKFIDLSNKYNLPIIIHSRDAIDLTYQILSEHKVNRGGVIHCYSANKYYVDKYVNLNFYFGIGGVITFKNANTLIESLKVMPIDRILLETDAPYLTPTPFRGLPNHSKYLKYILSKICEIKGLKELEMEEKSNNNFIKLFSVKL